MFENEQNIGVAVHIAYDRVSPATAICFGRVPGCNYFSGHATPSTIVLSYTHTAVVMGTGRVELKANGARGGRPTGGAGSRETASEGPRRTRRILAGARGKLGGGRFKERKSLGGLYGHSPAVRRGGVKEKEKDKDVYGKWATGRYAKCSVCCMFYMLYILCGTQSGCYGCGLGQ